MPISASARWRKFFPNRLITPCSVTTQCTSARLVTTPELQAMEKFQVENYGKVYFPGVPQLQQQIFKASFFGELIKKHLSMLLMEPVVTEKKDLHQKEWQMPGT